MKDEYIVKLHEKMLKTTKIDLNQKWMTSFDAYKIHSPKQERLMAANKLIF